MLLWTYDGFENMFFFPQHPIRYSKAELSEVGLAWEDEVREPIIIIIIHTHRHAAEPLWQILKCRGRSGR